MQLQPCLGTSVESLKQKGIEKELLSDRGWDGWTPSSPLSGVKFHVFLSTAAVKVGAALWVAAIGRSSKDN